MRSTLWRFFASLASSIFFVSSVSFVSFVRAQAALTEGPLLASIYDTILAARFDEAEKRLASACPPAPDEACRAMRVVSIWWRIQIDSRSRQFDAELERRAAAAIGAAEAWTAREPRRAEAWFYLAGSYAPLVQWRVLRGERLAAAREGAKIKSALERVLALDSGLADAYFGIGLYHYYADVAPAAAKFLRWLLLLPGGDRVRGLEEMRKARRQGVLLRGEADYQLHWLYLWYEENPKGALGLLQALDAQYPSNPVFLQRIAEVHEEYFHDRAASGASWELLLSRAREGRVEFAPTAENAARLGLARHLLARSEPARALDHLQPIVNTRSNQPYGAQALAHLLIGDAYERLGERDRATAAFNAAIAHAPSDDPANVRTRARDALRSLGRRR